MKILSIDPGSNGALVRLELELKDNKIYYTVDFTPMPVIEDRTMIDSDAAAKWISSHPSDHIYLEHVHALFGSGAGATFRFGRMFGGIEGVVGGLGLKYNLVPPKTWQKQAWMPEFVPLKNDVMTAKDKSLKTAKLLFPDLDMRPSKRSKNDHDGVIDALLIALYGFKQNNFDFKGVFLPYISSLLSVKGG